MDKAKLARTVRDVTGFTLQEARLAVDATFDVIAETLRNGEQVRIANFITLDTEMTKPRTARNLYAGTEVFVPSYRKVKVKVGAELKKIVRGSE